jgi:glycosyltransferase involved in cell wall biosynthesis
MRRSHVGLDPLSDRYDFLATLNNKAIEYLSAKLPVISSPRKGTLYELLRRQGCGLSYDIRDVDGLTDTLLRLDRDRELLHRMSAEAGRTFSESFTAEKVYGQMMEQLELLVGCNNGTQSGGTRGKADG